MKSREAKSHYYMASGGIRTPSLVIFFAIGKQRLGLHSNESVALKQWAAPPPVLFPGLLRSCAFPSAPFIPTWLQLLASTRDSLPTCQILSQTLNTIHMFSKTCAKLSYLQAFAQALAFARNAFLQKWETDAFGPSEDGLVTLSSW